MNQAELEKKYWLKKKPYYYAQGIGAYAYERDRALITQFIGKVVGTILDVPCGAGRHSLHLKNLGNQVTSADINLDMLRATKKFAGTEVRVINLLQEPILDIQHDLILVSRLLFHYSFSYQKKILKNAIKMLKSHGYLVFDTLNPYSSRWFINKILISFIGKLILPKSVFKHEQSLYFNSKSNISEILCELNFEFIACKDAYLLPTRVYKCFPKFLYPMIDSIESICPNRLKVLTFWKFKKND